MKTESGIAHVGWGHCLRVFCVGPLCGPPLRWWVLCGVLPSVLVPCGWGPPLSCSWFPWQMFLILSLARAHALTVLELQGALCAEVIRLRVSCIQSDNTLSRNSLVYMSKAKLPIALTKFCRLD